MKLQIVFISVPQSAINKPLLKLSYFHAHLVQISSPSNYVTGCMGFLDVTIWRSVYLCMFQYKFEKQLLVFVVSVNSSPACNRTETNWPVSTKLGSLGVQWILFSNFELDIVWHFNGHITLGSKYTFTWIFTVWHTEPELVRTAERFRIRVLGIHW
jgi:hypothetical protein